MVKFKCLISGTIVSFSNPVDIVSTDAHPGYVRVDSEVKKTEDKHEAPKKVGRPAKSQAQTEQAE